MKILQKIQTPKITINDKFVYILDIYFNNGDKVKKDDIILEIETSKIVMEIKVNIGGHIKYFCKIGDKVITGEQIAVIYDSYDIQEENMNINKKEETDEKPFFSRDAKKLIVKYKLSKKIFNEKQIVRANDVENYILKKANSIKENLNGNFKSVTKPKIVIIGAAGQGADILEILNHYKIFNVVGFIDIKYGILEKYCDLPIIGNDDIIPNLKSMGINNVVVAALWLKGYKKIKNIFQKCINSSLSFPTIIHPTATVSPKAKIGSGCQIFSNVVIGAYSNIGNGCVLTSGAIISHDSCIGDFSFIAPSANLAGNVQIGKYCVIGMNASIYLRTKISDYSVIMNNENVIESR